VRLLVVFLFAAQAVYAAEPLKLVSWNLEWFPGGSPNAGAEAAAAKMFAAQNALRAINPHIVCLQEVRDWAAASELVSVLLGYHIAVTHEWFQSRDELWIGRQSLQTPIPVEGVKTAQFFSPPHMRQWAMEGMRFGGSTGSRGGEAFTLCRGVYFRLCIHRLFSIS
jgi:hypothetical protein